MSKQNLSNFFYNWKNELVTISVVFSCLLLAMTFPLNTAFQIIFRIAFFLILLPVLYIRLVLKKRLHDFGLNVSENRKGFFWASAMLVVSFLLAFILFYFFQLEDKYIVPIFIISNFGAFVFYETVVMGFILFTLGFFFHGFIQSALEKKLAAWSPVVQFMLFILFLFSIGKLSWQYTPLIIFSLTGGIVAYKSKSFIYSYIMGLIFVLFLDFYVINLFK